MPTPKRYRNICFTDYDVDLFHMIDWQEWDKLSYIVLGLETCPTTGRKHLQGYAEAHDQITLNTLKAFAPLAHFEERKGTAEEAAIYCKKEGDYFEKGSIKEQGKRNDIAEVKNLMSKGHGMAHIISNTNSYQALSFATKALPFYERKREWVPTVHWFFGPSGTGKTSTAYTDAIAKYGTVHIQNAASGWWQGYDAHEAVIIDEVRAGSALGFVTLLSLLDRYPCTIECKGGSRQFLAREIWLTSPFHPSHMYSRGEEEVRQLLRRLTDIRLFDVPIDAGTLTPEGYSEVRYSEVAGNTSE